MVPVANRRGEEWPKPNIIQDYNNVMSGTDRSDQMLSYHSGLRKTVRWYKQVGVHMIEMMLTNALYLYVKSAPNPHLNKYRENIMENLVGPPKKGNNRRPRGKYYCLSPVPPREKKKNMARKCCCCSTPQKCKETRYECPYYKERAALYVDPCFRFITRTLVFFGTTLTTTVVMPLQNSIYGIRFDKDFAS